MRRGASRDGETPADISATVRRSSGRTRSLHADHGMQPRCRSDTAMEIYMKTIIALLTTTVLVAGATTAMAAEQGSDEAPGYALSLKMAQGSGAYASARVPSRVRNSQVRNSQVRNSTFSISPFALEGR